VNKNGPQAPAYNQIIQRYGHEVDLLGLIDADEFIVTENGLKNDLNDFYQNDDFGAMGLNWKIYGSNNDFFSTCGLVIERFTQHSTSDYDNNRHIKTFVKPSYVERMAIHACTLKKGVYSTSRNENMRFDDSKARTLEVSYENLYVNHYVVKSRIEHFINKRKKGSAAGLATREKGIAYFKAHDENKLTSHFDINLINNVKHEIENLKSQMIAHTSFMLLGRGHIDVNTENRIISGWSFLENKRVPKYIKILIDDKEYKVVVDRERPDVINLGYASKLVCGFRLHLPQEIALNDKIIRGFIYGSIQDLKVSYR